MTRFGLEEYIADCVILLDHRVTEQVSTRRVRIVKYRGTLHGTSEYPFLIGKNGISVLPITSLGLEHKVSRERISSGVKELDNMLDGKGFYWQQHSDFRHRDREDQSRRGVCGCGLSARRTLFVFRLRGIHKSNH
jgi:KaiC/GvpD/RAD55 family RecA-like ATPase